MSASSRRAGAGFAAGLGALILAAPANAMPTARACGSWRPSTGTLTGTFIPPSPSLPRGEFVARVTFRFTAGEIAALRCTGSTALETDVVSEGGLSGGQRSVAGNMAGVYRD